MRKWNQSAGRSAKRLVTSELTVKFWEALRVPQRPLKHGLKDHALEEFDIDNRQDHDLVHSVDFIAKEISRRADLVERFLREEIDREPSSLF
jgi:hypothetical protein